MLKFKLNCLAVQSDEARIETLNVELIKSWIIFYYTSVYSENFQ